MTCKALHHVVLPATQIFPLLALLQLHNLPSISLIRWVNHKPFVLTFFFSLEYSDLRIWSSWPFLFIQECQLKYHVITSQIFQFKPFYLIMLSPHTMLYSVWHMSLPKIAFLIYVFALCLRALKYDFMRAVPWSVLLATISPVLRTVSDIRKLFRNICPVDQWINKINEWRHFPYTFLTCNVINLRKLTSTDPF